MVSLFFFFFGLKYNREELCLCFEMCDGQLFNMETLLKSYLRGLGELDEALKKELNMFQMNKGQRLWMME